MIQTVLDCIINQIFGVNYDLKFPSLDKFKSLASDEQDKVFPSWNDLNNKIKKFEYKVDERVTKLKDDIALQSAAKECFLVLPFPFDSLAEKIYDITPGSAREKIKQAVTYFRQLQSGGITKYNHILTNLEQVISVKDVEELRTRENLQKIYGILIDKLEFEKKIKIHTESPPTETKTDIEQTQSPQTNSKTPQSEQKSSTKFEDNKHDVVRIISKSGLPLVLRAEQNITIRDETRNEIVSLLKENAKLMEEITKLNEPATYDDEYLLRTANFYYFEGNREKSMEHYDLVLKKNPNKMTALNNKGVVLDSSGKYDDAIDCFNKALSSVPENVHVLCNKGIALYKNEKYNEALVCLDLALTLDASYVNALTFKGHSLYRLGKNNDALSCYNKVIRLDQKNSEALYNKACLCSLKGDEYGALTSLERAIRLDPSWIESAMTDKDLDRVRNNPHFLELVQSSN